MAKIISSNIYNIHREKKPLKNINLNQKQIYRNKYHRQNLIEIEIHHLEVF